MHFELLNASSQKELQLVSAERSSWSKHVSCKEDTVLMHLVSSANKRGVADCRESGRSLIKMINMRGLIVATDADTSITLDHGHDGCSPLRKVNGLNDSLIL